ncbi:MAG TPA: alpha-amylase family glycosyl hydrolase [Patescibacteria group bacterium]|nr:alpha-amylase family glycosyl hydrolase [Patescibacteria group bacterium]
MPPDKPIPRATYGVQFSTRFGFRDAARLVPYLAKLGVSHVYASPYLKARPGSGHGYDIVDHCVLNPELGDAADFEAFVAALAEAGMGHVLDFVPNHMGVGGSDNVWWLDVLEWGQGSPYAGFFDIDWGPERRSLGGKLLVPFLGDQYGAVLEAGKLSVVYDWTAGEFAVWAYDTHKLPVCPVDYGRLLDDAHPGLERLADSFRELPEQGPHLRRRARDLKRQLAELTAADREAFDRVQARLASLNGRPGAPASFDALDQLIQNQHWRAAYFLAAADDINYRRFFNINDLAGLQMEQPELFQRTHALVFQLIAESKLDGLRIDHVDGLLDPKGYCRRLVEQSPRPIYLLVEKILARHERLRDDWPVDGTTGYDVANLLTGVFVDAAGADLGSGGAAAERLQSPSGAASGDEGPAIQRPSDGQGVGGHRLLPLQPPARPQRGRRASGQLRRHRLRLPRRQCRAPAPLAQRHAGDLDPRHQTRRGRPRPLGGAGRNPRGVGASSRRLDPPAAGAARRRRAQRAALRQRRIHDLSDAAWRLAGRADRAGRRRRRHRSVPPANGGGGGQGHP